MSTDMKTTIGAGQQQSSVCVALSLAVEQHVVCQTVWPGLNSAAHVLGILRHANLNAQPLRGRPNGEVELAKPGRLGTPHRLQVVPTAPSWRPTDRVATTEPGHGDLRRVTATPTRSRRRGGRHDWARVVATGPGRRDRPKGRRELGVGVTWRDTVLVPRVSRWSW